MAGTVQCVFLIDESALLGRTQDSSESEDCSQLRLAILRLLCYLGTNRAKSGDCLRWSYKFFDPRGTSLQPMEKLGLFNFDLESFEEFEAKLILKTQRLREIQALANTSATSETFQAGNHISAEVLRMAFKQLYADYSWDTPDISSPVKTISRGRNFVQEQQENYVWVLAPFHLFLGRSSGNPFKRLLPKPLYLALTSLAHLFWMDMSEQTHSTSLLEWNKVLSVSSLSGPHALLPLSSLLGYGSAGPAKTGKKSSSLRLLLPTGGELFKLCLHSPWRLPSSLETLPEEARVCGSILGALCLRPPTIGCFLAWPSKDDHLAVSTFRQPFTGLMRHLTSQRRVLVFQFQTQEQDTVLCLLRPLGVQVCSLLVLESSVSLESLTKAEVPRAVACGQVLPPSVLERWAAVSNVKNCLQGESLLKRLPQTERRSAQLRLKHQQVLATILRHSSDFQTAQMTDACQIEAVPVVRSSQDKRRSSGSCMLPWEPPGPPGGSQGDGPFLGDPVSSSLDFCSFPDGEGDRNKVFEQLRNFYERSLEGAKSLETTAEVVAQFLQSLAQEDFDALSLGRREKLVLTAKDIGSKQKTSKDPPKRQREHCLQVLLLLELASLTLEGDNEQGPLHPCILQEVVILLRTFSFLTGPRELNVFLQETLKDRYGSRLRSLLEEIGDELNVPLFSSSSSSEEEETGAEINQPQTSLSVASSLSSSVCSSVGGQSSNSSRWGRAPSLLSIPASRRQIHVPRNMLPANHRNNEKKGRRGKELVNRKKSPVKKLKQRDRVRRNLFHKTKSESHISVRSSTQRSPQKTKVFKKSPTHPSASPRSGLRKSPRLQFKGKPSPKTPRLKVRPPSEGFTPNDMFPELAGTPSRTPQATGKRSMAGFTPDAKFPELLTDSPASCTRSKSTWSPPPLWRTPTSIKNSNNKAKRLSQRSRSASCIRNLNLDLDRTSPCKFNLGTSPKQISQKSGLPKDRPIGTPQKCTPSKAGLRSLCRTPSSKTSLPKDDIPQKCTPSKAGFRSLSRTPSFQDWTKYQFDTPVLTPKIEISSPSQLPLKMNSDDTPRLHRSGLNSATAKPHFSLLKNSSQDLKSSKTNVFSSPSKDKGIAINAPPRTQTLLQSPEKILVESNSAQSGTPSFRKRTPSKQAPIIETSSPRVSMNLEKRNCNSDKQNESFGKGRMYRSERPETLQKVNQSPSKSFPDSSKCLQTLQKIQSSAGFCEFPEKVLNSELLWFDFISKERLDKNDSRGKTVPGLMTEVSDLKKHSYNLSTMFNVSVQLQDILLDCRENTLERKNNSTMCASIANPDQSNLTQSSAFARVSPKNNSSELYTIMRTPRKLSVPFLKLNNVHAAHQFCIDHASTSVKEVAEESPHQRMRNIESDSAIPNLFCSEQENTNPEINSTQNVSTTSKQWEEHLGSRPVPKTSPVLSTRWPNKKRKMSPKCRDLTPDEHCSLFISPSAKHRRTFRTPSTQSLLHLTTSPVLALKQGSSSYKVPSNCRKKN